MFQKNLRRYAFWIAISVALILVFSLLPGDKHLPPQVPLWAWILIPAIAVFLLSCFFSVNNAENARSELSLDVDPRIKRWLIPAGLMLMATAIAWGMFYDYLEPVFKTDSPRIFVSFWLFAFGVMAILFRIALGALSLANRAADKAFGQEKSDRDA